MNNEDLTSFWLDEFFNEEHGVCSLCGNSGYLDTRPTAMSPRGASVGKLHFCICPNGRQMKKIYKKPCTTDDKAA